MSIETVPVDNRLTTQPEPVRQPTLDARAWVRWFWRQLTSMRTALVLLFFLALAAIPGSVFPQNGVNPLRVRSYIAEHRVVGPWLNRFGFFDVFAAPWFAAIYLLLFVSLAGCVLPRIRQHYRAARARPPAAPRVLSRLPVGRRWSTDDSPEQVLLTARTALKKSGYRVNHGASWVSAEKGYARETGNLLFHMGLLLLLFAVAYGSLYGMRGTAVVIAGDGFANTVTRYDALSYGRFTGPDSLTPFTMKLDTFTAQFVESGPQTGAPTTFRADVSVTSTPGAAPISGTIEVNHPLEVGTTKIFLLGHGYAPIFTVRDGQGHVAFSDAVPFLPQDGNFTSTGVIKVPDAQPSQLGFQAIFLPTASADPNIGPRSIFPDAKAPRVLLSGYRGDLGLDTGAPQSVFTLNTAKMTQVGIKGLTPGQSWAIPGGGSVSFDGYRRWVNLQISQEPGRGWVLTCIGTAIAGLVLSLTVRRRRLFVRVSAQAPPGSGSGSGTGAEVCADTVGDTGSRDGSQQLGRMRTVVSVAGLARTDTAGLDDEVDDWVMVLRGETMSSKK